MFVTTIDSVIIYFFINGQFLFGFIIGFPFVFGIVIYYIVTRKNHILKLKGFLFAICISSYVFLAFISHSSVKNQSVEFLKDILTGIELPIALTLISASSTESNPKNDKLLADVNEQMTKLLTECSNKNAKKLTKVNDQITQLLTIVDNKNNEHSPEINDKNIELLEISNRNSDKLTKVNDKITELLTENKTRKKVQPRRILQVKKLHKNNRLTNIKR